MFSLALLVPKVCDLWALAVCVTVTPSGGNQYCGYHQPQRPQCQGAWEVRAGWSLHKGEPELMCDLGFLVNVFVWF